MRIMKFFNPEENIEKYRGILPHWRQTGVTYFVTFRQADSLPVGKLEALQEDVSGEKRTRVHCPTLRKENMQFAFQAESAIGSTLATVNVHWPLPKFVK